MKEGLPVPAEAESFTARPLDPLEFGGQGGRPKPPPKIRGSQFVRREEKKRPKLIVKIPFIQRPPKSNQ